VRRNRSSIAPNVPFQAIELLRLTNSGRVNDSAISPDGQYVAYVVRERRKTQYLVREVNTSNNTQIVSPADTQFYGATFSRDSHELYYIAKERNNSIGGLYRVPALGGTQSKSSTTWTVRSRFLPTRNSLPLSGSALAKEALMLANVDGTGERKLASRMGYESFSFGGPAWSPDGKGIVSGAAYADDKGDS
jgi:Tol biopolymer transport system component